MDIAYYTPKTATYSLDSSIDNAWFVCNFLQKGNYVAQRIISTSPYPQIPTTTPIYVLDYSHATTPTRISVRGQRFGTSHVHPTIVVWVYKTI